MIAITTSSSIKVKAVREHLVFDLNMERYSKQKNWNQNPSNALAKSGLAVDRYKRAIKASRDHSHRNGTTE